MNNLCLKITREQEDLTLEQVAYADQFAQERIAAMFSTAPIDEKEAEEHLRAACHAVKPKAKPVQIHWFDSPAAFALAFFSNKGNNVKKSLLQRVDNVQDSVWNSAWFRVGYRVQNSVRYSVSGIVYRSVWNFLEGSMGHSVWDPLENVVAHSVRDLLKDGIWHFIDESYPFEDIDGLVPRAQSLVEVFMRDLLRAYYRADLLSCCRFFHEMFEENEMIHLALFNEMVSGYYLEGKQAWLVRKPIRLERDAQGRLHSSDGMCIQYRDGWGMYAWHGIRCSEKLILHPEQLTKEDWMTEGNLGIRRIMQERIGNERFVQMIGGECIDQGQGVDLIEVNLGWDFERAARFVRVKDTSTEQVHYLRVPTSFDKADEALAWTSSSEGQEYQPIQEV